MKAVMHISVCICTYRRPQLLRRLLEQLAGQITGGDFTFSIVVSDNDVALSGCPVVEAFAARSLISIVYCTEPQRNIALARNRAVEHARGEFVAWIDDDEFPDPEWLRNLFAAAQHYKVAGVLGPVRPHFDEPPPRWLLDGRFCERAEYVTGTVLHWSQSFAGNALLRLEMLRQFPAPFCAEFGLGGEDVDFFRRMALLGHQFVWCNEAVVHEVVSPVRWTRSYRLKRAMMLGRSSLKLADSKALVKSFIAVPIYSLLLPVTLCFGQHVFMKYSIKLSGHLGRLLALFGLNPINQRAG
jgi:succinoglycan biosynthesis protein ExoM